MSLLTDLQNERVPSSEDLAVRVKKRKKRIFGPWKLCLMAILWLFSVAELAGLLFLFGAVALMRLAGTHKGGTIEQIIGLGAFGISQLFAWSWFALRVRRRRASAVRVGREGTFVETTLYRVAWSRRRHAIYRLWRMALRARRPAVRRLVQLRGPLGG